MNPVVRNYFRYKDLHIDENWDTLLTDILNLFDVNFSAWKKAFTVEELKKNVPQGNVARLLEYFFEQEAIANNKQFGFIKEIKIFEIFPFLLVNYPEAKYVYLVRDPRDMALSWKNSKIHRGGIVAAARQWKEDQQQSLKNYELMRPMNKALMLKYEDLIANTKAAVTQVLEFLGFSYEEEIIDFHKDELTAKNAGSQDAWANLSKGVMSENAGKYASQLSKEEIMIIEKICYPEMRLLEYLPEYSITELATVSEARIEEFSREELSSLPYTLNEGVRENMEAKKVFYQKII